MFGEEYPQGFVLSPLSSYQNASIAMIYSGQQGTKGVFVNEGGIVDWASQRVSWYGEFIACFVSRRSRCADNVEQLATRH